MLRLSILFKWQFKQTIECFILRQKDCPFLLQKSFRKTTTPLSYRSLYKKYLMWNMFRRREVLLILMCHTAKCHSPILFNYIQSETAEYGRENVTILDLCYLNKGSSRLWKKKIPFSTKALYLNLVFILILVCENYYLFLQIFIGLLSNDTQYDLQSCCWAYRKEKLAGVIRPTLCSATVAARWQTSSKSLQFLYLH